MREVIYCSFVSIKYTIMSTKIKQERQIMHLQLIMSIFQHEEDSVALKLLECLDEEEERFSLIFS